MSRSTTVLHNVLTSAMFRNSAGKSRTRTHLASLASICAGVAACAFILGIPSFQASTAAINSFAAWECTNSARITVDSSAPKIASTHSCKVFAVSSEGKVVHPNTEQRTGGFNFCPHLFWNHSRGLLCASGTTLRTATHMGPAGAAAAFNASSCCILATYACSSSCAVARTAGITWQASFSGPCHSGSLTSGNSELACDLAWTPSACNFFTNSSAAS
mmetsp:Transcript_10366/g.22982  ORF Transcript_10366/g.22982 Transcript_10366/m.22982 type:complete len:217 (+) Transcript_10366:603-1253(+)